jgi:hypothetical protein
MMGLGKVRKRGGKAQGVALVTVISVLAMMVLLTVAMLGMATRERAVAGSMGDGAAAQALKDLATGLVISQMRSATEGDQLLAWATQPGAVWTWDMRGRFVRGHRLYSDSVMVEGDAASLMGSSPPADWDSEANRARYVDLNAPVIRAAGDGLAELEAIYPILDPRAEGLVGGFGFEAGINGVVRAGDHRARLPMPVEWLYVLEDGSLGTLSAAGSFVGDGVASLDNPIVGRVAFYADDETSKLNLNTASEPTFWDTPRVAGKDRMYARFQPAAREYQRYPGHPATTALSPVFGGSLLAGEVPLELKRAVYRTIPRVGVGGSDGGTQNPHTQSGFGGAVVDADRLFASGAELLLRPDRRLADELLAGNGALASAALRRASGFLTVHSRAPETTLFNTPRLVVWPVSDESRYHEQTRTAFDQRVAFCSNTRAWDASLAHDRTSNPNSAQRYDYVFRRIDEDENSGDYNRILRNRQLYEYLREMTALPFPGFGPGAGATFAQKYGIDRDQILTQMYDYVRSTNLFDDSLGLGSDATGGVSNSHRQFTDGRGSQGFGKVTPAQLTHNDTLGFGRFVTISEASLVFLCNADAAGGADGLLDSNVVEGDGSGKPFNKMLTTKLVGDQRRVQACLIFEFFSPMQGWNGIGGEFRVRVTFDNLSSEFLVNGQSMGFGQGNFLTNRYVYPAAWHERAWGGNLGFRTFLRSANMPARPGTAGSADSGGNGTYHWVSAPLTVAPDSSGRMQFTGGKLTVELIDTGLAPGTVQSIELDFPSAAVPVPELVRTGTPAAYGSTADPNTLNAPATSAQDWWSFTFGGGGCGATAGRFRHADRNPEQGGGPLAGAFIRKEDTVLSLVPRHGDFRLIAGRRKVPSTVFVPHQFYGTSNRMAHHHRSTASPYHIQGGSESLGAMVPHPSGSGLLWGSWGRPNFPKVAEGQQLYGDFDHAVSVTVDGPYINKPDEGNVRDLAGGGDPYYQTNWTQDLGGATFFSPNRQMPGPGMFGSLPVGVKREIPWQTLLFRPAGAGVGDYPRRHPSRDVNPPDHLWLDLFWMPVVEPYSISDAFSTAGKVNMNYRMANFPHIRRATALHGVFGDEQLLAVPTGEAGRYKSSSLDVNAQIVAAGGYRKRLDREETLKQFDERFAGGDLFRSASEICDIHLVPEGQTVAAMEGGFWGLHRLTGENARERAYTNLHTRLTTRSNTFRVHVIAQSLQKSRGSDPGGFDPAVDRVAATWRGSTVLERFIDPVHDPAAPIPDYATRDLKLLNGPSLKTLDFYYQWRVLEEERGP